MKTKSKDLKKSKAPKAFVKAMEKQYPKGAVVTPMKNKKK
jgi:hypothetical protein